MMRQSNPLPCTAHVQGKATTHAVLLLAGLASAILSLMAGLVPILAVVMKYESAWVSESVLTLPAVYSRL